MSKEGEAQIVSLSELMSDDIGGAKKEFEKNESDKDLAKAVEGKPETYDFFNLDSAKQEAEEDKKKEEEEKGESEKVDTEVEVKEATLEETLNGTADSIIKDTSESLVYKRTLKSMFGDSITHLIQEDEEGNEVETPIEDIVINEQLFQQIVQSKMDNIKEEASKDKISVKGVSEFAKKLVEIDRNGGDISELIKVKETYADPLDSIDVTTEEGQVQAIYLRMLAGGQDEDTIRRLIESYKREGSLEEIANKASQELRDAIDQQIENARIESENQRNQRKDLIKQYKKEIRNNLESFQLNDNIKNKIVTLATKEDENGRFEMDRLYYQLRENPEKAARLALFLLDEDEYVKQVTNSTVQKKKLESASKLKIVSGSKSSNAGPQLKSNSQRSSEDNILPLDRLGQI
jgi:hypothetical protein